MIVFYERTVLKEANQQLECDFGIFVLLFGAFMWVVCVWVWMRAYALDYGLALKENGIFLANECSMHFIVLTLNCYLQRNNFNRNCRFDAKHAAKIIIDVHFSMHGYFLLYSILSANYLLLSLLFQLFFFLSLHNLLWTIDECRTKLPINSFMPISWTVARYVKRNFFIEICFIHSFRFGFFFLFCFSATCFPFQFERHYAHTIFING